MNIDIQATEDENFKITTKKFGEQHLASDGERVVIAITEEKAIEGVRELQEQNKVVESQRGPKPAPLDNPKCSGVSWFSGTSWDTNNR
jgi:CRISPR/Cas system-associated exonuclease Cas4 (RecB family)